MSEIPELPPLNRPALPPPAGGLESAMADGRRRRNRFLGAAGGSTTAVALVLAAALAAPAGRDDSLQFAEPEPTASADAEATPDASPAPDPSPAASAGASEPPGEPAATPAPEQQQPGASVDEPPDGDQPQDADRREPYLEEPAESAAPAVCQGAPGQTDPLIVSASGCVTGGETTSTAPQGGQARGEFGYCNSYNEDDIVLRYDDGREHEVRVYQGGEGGPLVWTFSQTVRYTQGPHERRIPGGRCLGWTGVWDTTLADGTDAPAGEYWMVVSAVPDQVNDWKANEGDGGGVAFPVTVTADEQP